jgi:hypothetical protein
VLNAAEYNELKAGRDAEATGAHAVVAGTERARKDSVLQWNFIVDLLITALLQIEEKW